MPASPSLTRRQAPGQSSPWPLSSRLAAAAWGVAWTLTCRWTPKPLNPWRLLLLRIFGAKIRGVPFVHQRALVERPWNVELHDRACVGDHARLYALDRIVIGADAIVAQETYLCCGTHDFADPERPLLTGPITVGPRAFVGARAFVLPGVAIGEGAIVGAGSVVTRDVPAGKTAAGNPARVKQR